MSKKQFLSLIFAFCLVFVLAACGETDAAPSSEPGNATVSTEGTDPSGDPAGDPTTPSSPNKSDDPSEPAETQPPADTESENSQTITAVVLSSTNVELAKPGDTYTLSVTFEPLTANPQITFGSDDPEVADIDSTGLITAIGPGTCTITVTCGGMVTECTVTCSDFTTENPDENPETDPNPDATDEPIFPEDEENEL